MMTMEVLRTPFQPSMSFLLVIWFSMGRTTLIPSKAKMAVPKKIGKFDVLD